MKMSPAILRYVEAMNASAFDSTVASVMSYLGAAGAHQAASEFGWNVAALTLQQFALVALSAFGAGCLKYLHEHPLTGLLPKEDGK